ncbi:2-oxoacid:ferredoxin oxidoreductase subunit alpha [Palaeococcus pacificus DY20341]|uniref:2-oxoglutarate synthase subunit KorA n=1 Tax=Palaeococcus pacificus DY20341 TaxID=1343739 RepID=A0A075LSK9_9EURY|nr:2-oxoacid:acceptor oxidoreductase subunit alpha [Palaeococcus pacificus]AIF69081.1 2-oxoacid:ferredoxin oxidoreductase subunit alpha [Palaeococcus pacificus DY20341]
MVEFEDDISIILGGAAGQGIQTVEEILTRVLKLSGYNIYANKEYMSRVRGGINTTEIRVSSDRARTFVRKIDILIPFKRGVLPWVEGRISRNTVVLGERENVEEEFLGKVNFIEVPFTKMAREVGNTLYLNTIAAGIVVGLFYGEVEILKDYLTKRFASKGQNVVEKNVEAALKGYEFGKNLCEEGIIGISVAKKEEVKDEILLSGAEAVALGALAGGMNFLSFYPMSPSTGVAVFLAQHAEDFDIIVEQVEDEISAINMALGAWFAGARGMVTTSGGGFALMTEAISLAGMAENPVVIHLAQRPGPATGLPTRTMQSDLNLALYAGHGEFPRIIFAPGTIEDAFYLTQMAFNLADKYQVPVIILTDEYLMDSYYNLPDVDLEKIRVEKHIIKTPKDYKRYELTENGVSPRGIPGYGKGIVLANGNEHDEYGDITEDEELNALMQEKRNKKLEAIKREAIPPELIGSEDYKYLVIGWGSTYYAIKEALERLERDDVAFLHFKQVYPLSEKSKEYFERAEVLIDVELNVTAQFAQLLKKEFGISVDYTVLKYNGRPFSVEELVEKLSAILEGRE